MLSLELPQIIICTGHPQSTNEFFDFNCTESAHFQDLRAKERVWSELKPLIMRAMVEELSPQTLECSVCKLSPPDCGDTIYRCLDCGPTTYYCLKHCYDSHWHLALHQPQGWDVTLLKWEPVKYPDDPDDWPLFFWRMNVHPTTDDCRLYKQKKELIDERGRFPIL